jgi:hypothetical protein
MDIKKSIGSAGSTLIVAPSLEIDDIVLENMSFLSTNKVCYITLKKTYGFLENVFKRHDVNVKHFSFIDVISKVLMHAPDKAGNCLYLFPYFTDDFWNSIVDFAGKSDYVVFDSLTNLLAYRGNKEVLQMVKVFLEKMKSKKVKVIFYAMSNVGHDDLIRNMEALFDKVIKI